MTEPILVSISEYYRKTVSKYGASAKGLDWSGNEGHQFRIALALDQISLEKGDSILDFGCGYGSLLGSVLDRKLELGKYVGFDIVPEMLVHAESIWGASDSVQWVNRIPSEHLDYSFAIGTFHVRPPGREEDFLNEIRASVSHMSKYSRKGWVISFLDNPSSERFHKNHLQYFSAESLDFFLQPLAQGFSLRIIKSPRVYELLAVATKEQGPS